MNLLQKQGFYNSIILYAGTVLGFLNLIILFQRILTKEEIGFYTLVITISGLYAQIASLGVNGVILKYFPVFRTDDKTHKGFITLVVFWSTLSFAAFTLLFVLFKGLILSHYEDKSGAGLMVQHYYYLIPISFLTLLFTVLESLARTVFKNVFSAFLKEFLLRFMTSVSVLLMAASWFGYNGFLMAYLVANALIAALLWYNIAKGQHFKFGQISREVKTQRKELLNYGLFSVISGGSFGLVQGMAVLMLSVIADRSLELVGIYGTFFGIAVVISLPAKALGRTSYQIVSEAWAQNDLRKIDRIYKKTSLVQFIIGCLLLIGLIINYDHILFLMHKPEYDQYFWVFVIVGLTFLVDITGGLNGQIINFSRYYRYTTYMITVAVFVCAFLNWLLIPQFGLIGAALSYLLIMVILNFLYWLFILLKFKLQPFDSKYLAVLLISALSLAVGVYIPVFDHFLVDITLRSLAATLVFTGAVLGFNISEDINELYRNALRKAGFK